LEGIILTLWSGGTFSFSFGRNIVPTAVELLAVGFLFDPIRISLLSHCTDFVLAGRIVGQQARACLSQMRNTIATDCRKDGDSKHLLADYQCALSNIGDKILSCNVPSNPAVAHNVETCYELLPFLIRTLKLVENLNESSHGGSIPTGCNGDTGSNGHQKLLDYLVARIAQGTPQALLLFTAASESYGCLSTPKIIALKVTKLSVGLRLSIDISHACFVQKEAVMQLLRRGALADDQIVGFMKQFLHILRSRYTCIFINFTKS
jgi:hypothetical protein